MSRPMKFQSVEQLQSLIEEYFEVAESSGTPLTVTGLCLHLDTTRETMMDYQENPMFSDTVKKAKLRVENYAEKKLYGNSPTGPIFALKNFGWTDKLVQEHTGDAFASLYGVISGKSAELPVENPL